MASSLDTLDQRTAFLSVKVMTVCSYQIILLGAFAANHFSN